MLKEEGKSSKGKRWFLLGYYLPTLALTRSGSMGWAFALSAVRHPRYFGH
jgi:hypothetical protein